MARYTGPKTKISRIFGEPILGNGKWLNKNSNPPGQHGAQRKRKSLGEYALQLREKQKAKYTYGVLEKQFRKTFEEAARRKGVTGENLIGQYYLSYGYCSFTSCRKTISKPQTYYCKW